MATLTSVDNLGSRVDVTGIKNKVGRTRLANMACGFRNCGYTVTEGQNWLASTDPVTGYNVTVTLSIYGPTSNQRTSRDGGNTWEAGK